MKSKKTVFSFVAFSIVGIFALISLPHAQGPAPLPASGDETKPSFAQESTHAEEKLTEDAGNNSSTVATTSADRTARSVRSSDKIFETNGETYPIRVYKPLALPNDPYVNQWWVDTTKMADVWAAPQPSVSTTLAIIDTGFALQHEEFTHRWYRNPGETGTATEESSSVLNCTDRSLSLDMSCNRIDDDRDGIVDNETGPVTQENPSSLNCTDQQLPLAKECNQIDDDGNGFIDDVTGWDFMSFDNSVQAGELNPTGSGTTHGTMVAGVAAATGNNSKGVSGIDWQTKILPLQALDDDSYGDTMSVGDAIYYAVEQNVDVISISLGSTLPDTYVQKAVQAALAKGIVVVAASGNDGCDCMVYPAKYPEVLAVGALNSSGAPASFSSWGAELDMLAPGTQMTTTTWSTGNQSAAYASGVNGTSFATPMVGGMLTRLISQQSTATPQQLIATITATTNRLTLGNTTSHSTQLGYGGLHALQAVNRMTTANDSQMKYAFTPVYKGTYFSTATPLESTGPYRVYRCSAGRPGATPVYEMSKPGRRFFTVSEVERQRAIADGYISTIFAYGCMQQPHDTQTTVRDLNIFGEFKNLPRKQ